MKKKTILILALLVILFTGCQRNEFEASSVRLIQRRTDDSRTLVFSCFPSDEESSYAVTVTSPDGELTWKGNLEKRADSSYALDMLITPGTDFPAGDYRYMIYSSNGTEKEGSVRFPGAMDVSYTVEGTVVKFDVPGKVHAVRDGEETEAVSPFDFSGWDAITYTDEHFNTYEFTITY